MELNSFMYLEEKEFSVEAWDVRRDSFEDMPWLERIIFDMSNDNWKDYEYKEVNRYIFGVKFKFLW